MALSMLWSLVVEMVWKPDKLVTDLLTNCLISQAVSWGLPQHTVLLPLKLPEKVYTFSFCRQNEKYIYYWSRVLWGLRCYLSINRLKSHIREPSILSLTNPHVASDVFKPIKDWLWDWLWNWLWNWYGVRDVNRLIGNTLYHYQFCCVLTVSLKLIDSFRAIPRCDKG